MKKLFGVLMCLSFMVVFAYGMGMFRNGAGSIAAHTAIAANHRDSGSVYMVAGMENYKSLQVRIKLAKPDAARWPATHTPLGNCDTGSLRLVTYMGGKRFLLDSINKAVLPCSLTVSHAGTTAGADTLLKQILAFEYQIADTISDTAINYNVDYEWEIIAKE